MGDEFAGFDCPFVGIGIEETERGIRYVEGYGYRLAGLQEYFLETLVCLLRLSTEASGSLI